MSKSHGPTYDYPVPLDTVDQVAILRMPRELCRHDAEKIKRVIDALAFDDEVLDRWEAERERAKLLVELRRVHLGNVVRAHLIASHLTLTPA